MRVFKSLAVSICGLVTSVMVAIGVVLIARLVHLNIFTFMILFVIPVGALVTGVASASGYYFASLYFHTRPSKLLLFQMAIVAGFSEWLIYYLDYATYILDDGRRVASLLSFDQFLDVVLTKATYAGGRGGRIKSPEVGELGYWIAGLQFLGFLTGGAICWIFLRARPVCERCKTYYRPLGSVTKTFADQELFVQYYDMIFRVPVDSPLFADALRTLPPKKRLKSGAVVLTTSLLGCPACKQQIVTDEVQIHNGQEWKTIEQLKRTTRIPEGIRLTKLFRKRKADTGLSAH